MPSRIIEAKLKLTGSDAGASDVIDKVAKKLGQLEQAGKSASAIDRMAASIDRAKLQMEALDRFNRARGGFADARTRFREAQIAVERHAKALAAAEAPTRALEMAHRKAASAVSLAAKAFEQQKIEVLSSKRALEGFGAPVKNVAAEQDRLRKSIERTTAAMARQKRNAVRREEIGNAAGLVGLMAAHKVAHAGRATLETYREFDKERRFGKAVMGLTDEEQKPLVEQAIHMGAKTKFNDIQVLEAQRELAARGLKKDQVMGMMEPAGNLGMSMDLKLPDAVKQLEGAIFGFKKDISTLPAALASAKQTADLQVKAAKISGMTPDDIKAAYKFGATPSRMSGVSEQTLLAFAGIGKKANMGGDESGVAFRALMAAAQSPTRGAKEALLANGLNYKNYQKTPDSLALDPFVQNVAAQYGVKLDKKTQKGLGKIFTNKKLISDPAKFTPAVMSFLSDNLGGDDAKSKRSIAGMANRYRDKSMGGIDVNAFIADLLKKIPGNLQLANAVFGAKQGGRIATALGDPETFKHMIEELLSGSEGYAKKIADERMAGFDGAVSKFQGAVKNLETAVGRSFDRDGSGGPLTWITDKAATLTQSLAELDSKVVMVGASLVGAGGLYAGIKGIISLKNLFTGGTALNASAVALDHSAAALTAAAVRLGAGGAAGGALDAAAKAAPAAAAAPGMLARGAAALPFAGAIALPAALLAASYPLTKDAANPGAAESRAARGRSLRGSRVAQWNEDRDRMGIPRLGDGKTEITGTADVDGKMEVKVTVEDKRVTVKGDDSARLSGRVNLSGAGSVGKSSPDAQPGASGAW
jgi:TP901 family phage tail tape measure protein